MADQLPALPPGFTLDMRPTKENAAKLPPLPEGFALDNPRIERGGILPVSRNLDTGEVSFDPHSGILGALLSGFTAPGDVAAGRLDPNSPEGQSRAYDTMGLLLGGNPMVASGDRAIPGALKALRPQKPKVPTAQELTAAGAAGFKKAEGMGVDYTTASVKSLVDDISQLLERKSIRESRAPGTFDIIKDIRGGPDQSVVSLTGLREIREAFRNITGDFGLATSKTDRKAAQDAIRAIDRFLEEPPPSSAVAGIGVGDGGTAVTRATPESFVDAIRRAQQSGAEKLAARDRAAEAGAAVKEANANYAAGERSNTVTRKVEKAEIGAQSTGSGLNLDNKTRQILAAIIDPERPRNRRGFSQEELAVIKDIVDGKHGADAARWLGNTLGGGSGLGAISAGGVGSALGGAAGALLGGPTGAAIGAPIGGALPIAAGLGFRKLANKITTNQAQRLDELIRMRSPLFQQRVANPEMQAASPELPMALLRLFGLGYGQEAQP